MSAVSTQAVEIREARFQDYQALAALEALHGLPAKPQDEWRRLWSGNPYYEELGPRWPIGWVLEDGHRIVGSLTNVPAPHVLEGRKVVGAIARGWALDPAYRQHASLLMSQYLDQENVDLFFTQTNNAETNEVFSKAGAQRCPVGDWSVAAYAITEPRGFAASALRGKNVPLADALSHPAGFILSLKERFTAPAIPRSDIEVSKARDFDQRFDTFWEILGHRSEGMIAVRSREALKGRFGPALDKNRLWILVAARNGNIDGYAIFERCDEAKSGLKRMRLADFQACDWQDQYCAAFFSRAYEECRAAGIHVLENIGCEMQKTRIFDEAAPHRRHLRDSHLLYFARNQELAGCLARPESWAPAFSDVGAICS